MASAPPSIANRIWVVIIVALVVTISCRYILLDAPDPYKCGALETKGRWLDDRKAPLPRFQDWQPPGCMLHQYEAADIHRCLACRRALFIGDSTVRQIFWAVARKLDGEGAEQTRLTSGKHGNLTFERECTHLEFLWDPFLNSSRLYEELSRQQHRASNITGLRATQAAVILAGGGLWHARYLGYDYMTEFQENVDRISKFSHRRDEPKVQDAVTIPPILRPNPTTLFLTPVHHPYYQKLSTERAESILPEKVLAMNDYLRHIAPQHGLEVLWSFVPMSWHLRSAYEEDGLHVVDSIATRQADVVLNARCNSEPVLAHYPFEKTCCNGWVDTDHTQDILIFLAISVSSCTVCAFIVYNCLHHGCATAPFSAHSPLSTTSGVLAGAILYCFVADRTTIFEKEHKICDQKVFLRLSALAVTVGVISMRRSGHPTSKLLSPKPGLDQSITEQPLLSRQQTDEWKGWMQCMILIYHYTGMSQILVIYKIVRLLVASYLFLTGFGHTVYFCQTSDYSSRRVITVLVRMNLLSCILPYVMRTDYQFYYFPALCSFWFVVIYLTMKVCHSRNGQTGFVLSKVVLAAITTTCLNDTPGVLETVFALLRWTCNIKWDVAEWRFRVSLDMYIVYVGMIVAIVYVQLTVSASVWQSHTATRFIPRHSTIALISSVVISAVTFPGYWLITRQFSDKYAFNKWHPYTSFAPILAFVLLRNAHRRLRDVHSSCFAWLGRCSLETFILQYHVWLAGDTKGILRLGIVGHRDRAWTRWLDLLLTSSVFLWVSWHVSQATNVLTSAVTGTMSSRRGGKGTAVASGNGHNDPTRFIGDLPAFHVRKGRGITKESGIDGPGTDWIRRLGHFLVEKDNAMMLRIAILLTIAWTLNWVY